MDNNKYLTPKRDNVFVIILVLIIIIFLSFKDTETIDTYTYVESTEVTMELTTETVISTEPTKNTEKIITLNDFTIFIDPGHGFSDSGAEAPKEIGYEISESEITLKISKKLEDVLIKRGLNVILSRTTDYDERQKNEHIKFTKEQRTEMANKSNADVFISLHIDSYDKSADINGYTIYYSNNNETNNLDKQLLSEYIMECFIGATKLEKIKIKPMTEDISYYVIKNTTMPSILFELGYCTNKEDASRIVDEDWQTNAIEGIANGIVKYINTKIQ